MLKIVFGDTSTVEIRWKIDFYGIFWRLLMEFGEFLMKIQLCPF